MQNKKKKDIIWIFKVLVLTLFLALVFSVVSEVVVKNSHVVIAFIILILLIGISIGFDIISTATASCHEDTFHAMASRKIRGAKIAVYFAKNQSRVTSICGDVIGDICGILSGAAGSSIIIKLITNPEGDILIYSIVLSAIIAAATITGKAIAKIYAINNADKVVLRVAKLLSVFKKNS